MSTKHKQFRMADVTDKRMKQIVVIEFLPAEKFSPREIYRYLNSVCGEHTIEILGQVF
jgi:hypothetical protein